MILVLRRPTYTDSFIKVNFNEANLQSLSMNWVTHNVEDALDFPSDKIEIEYTAYDTMVRSVWLTAKLIKGELVEKKILDWKEVK